MLLLEHEPPPYELYLYRDFVQRLAASLALGRPHYSFTYPQTRGGFSGGQLRFIKTGYQTFDAAVITESEVGWKPCGDCRVVRDAGLTP